MKHLTTHRLKLPFNGFEDIEGDYEDLLFAQEYVVAFNAFLRSKNLQVSLTFEELDSPKFYDNDVDKIYAKINEQDLMTLWDHVDKDELSRTVHDRFGENFNPAEDYPPTLSRGDWLKPVIEWDLIQLETLLQALLIQHEVSLDCEDIIELIDLNKTIEVKKEQQNNGR
jgi:hypothetical protein